MQEPEIEICSSMLDALNECVEVCPFGDILSFDLSFIQTDIYEHFFFLNFDKVALFPFCFPTNTITMDNHLFPESFARGSFLNFVSRLAYLFARETNSIVLLDFWNAFG